MWSTPPAEPPPTDTPPGFFLSAFVKSLTLLKGESFGTATALFSMVSRARGVTWSSVTGALLVRMPPTMTEPMTMNALSAPRCWFTNSARPIVPAAPPLLVTCAPSLWMPSFSRAFSTARPVESHPPPGLAGTITLSGSAAAGAPARARAAASAAPASPVRLMRTSVSSGRPVRNVILHRPAGEAGIDGEVRPADQPAERLELLLLVGGDVEHPARRREGPRRRGGHVLVPHRPGRGPRDQEVREDPAEHRDRGVEEGHVEHLPLARPLAV